MNPIARIADHLRESGVSFAVIGAAAMSARGFPRQTLDLDLLTTDARVLQAEFWRGVSPAPEVRIGDSDDPLRGVVRFDDPHIDLVVGRSSWQSDALLRAQEMTLGDAKLPVVTLADLIALKLDAGGYRDAADVSMMLARATPEDIRQIDAVLGRLDAHAARLWKEIRGAASE